MGQREGSRNRNTVVHTSGRTGSPSRGPVRTCVGCRTRALATELLRVVVVDGTLVPDVRRRCPGRGAWVHLDPECLRNAERRRAFPRALRVPGPLDATGVIDYLERRLSVQSGPESRSTRHESAVKLKP